jgi:hypothetical protein
MTENKKPVAKKAPARKPAPKKPAAKQPTPPPVAEEDKTPTPERIAPAKPVPSTDEEPGKPEQQQDLSGLDDLIGAESKSETVSPEMEKDKAKQAEREADELAARQGAIMATSFAETLLGMKFPGVAIQQEQKDAIVEKATPVMLKYGAGLPDWLQPYREEIELGMVIASTGVGVYVQVQQLKIQQKREAIAAQRKAQQEQEEGQPKPSHRVDLSRDDQGQEQGDARAVSAA